MGGNSTLIISNWLEIMLCYHALVFYFEITILFDLNVAIK